MTSFFGQESRHEIFVTASSLP